MDMLMEFLLELFFETPIEMAMGSKRLKTWVKTLLFALLGGSISVLLCIIALTPPVEPEIGVLCAIWTIFVIIGAVVGHRSKWKQK